MLRRHLMVLFPLCAAACATAGPARDLGPTRPYGGNAHAIPGLIEAEHYDEGRPEEAYRDVDERNRGVGYRGVSHVDIEQRPDASNGHGVGWTKAGEWLVYTVAVAREGSYTAEFPVASNNLGGTFHLEVDGVDVTGPIQVPNTGAWTKLETIRKEKIQLRKGVFLMKLVMDTNGPSQGVADFDYIRFIAER